MSILIKGMAMPKNCGECPFATPTRDGLMCDAVSFLAKCLTHPVSRMSCCPLIELPSHGDLIDRDALNIDISKSVVFTVAKNRPSAEMRGAFKVLDRLGIAPAIIEAEGEG